MVMHQMGSLSNDQRPAVVRLQRLLTGENNCTIDCPLPEAKRKEGTENEQRNSADVETASLCVIMEGIDIDSFFSGVSFSQKSQSLGDVFYQSNGIV